MKHQLRYGAIAQGFHWATAILVLLAFAYGPGGPEPRVYSVASDFGRQLHETLGLLVFAVVVMRVLWRLIDTHSNLPRISGWTGIAAKVVQAALYMVLFALPLTAIAGAWLEGHPLTLLWGGEIPSLLGISHDAGATIATVHRWFGNAILWLAGSHALAALFHHFVLKDGVLASMLPRWVPLRAQAFQKP
jgi:cytochrome b561